MHHFENIYVLQLTTSANIFTDWHAGACSKDPIYVLLFANLNTTDCAMS